MAAYNAGAFIEKALEGVFAQTYADFQLIVVDDASTDNTQEVLGKFKDDRLVVLRNTGRSGAAYSRNRALEEAKGKYVAVLDADDFWDCHKLQIQVRFLEKNKKAAAIGTYAYETDSGGEPVKSLRFPTEPEKIKCSTFFRCSIVHSSIMLRRSFLHDKNLWYNPDFKGAHDFELWSRAVFCGAFHQLPEYLTYYRRSPEQISTAMQGIQEGFAAQVYKTLLQRLGFSPTEKQLQNHLQLAGIQPPEPSGGTREVLRWCLTLNEKNKMVRLFDRRLFADEILLRYLKYCRDTSVGLFRTAGWLLWLHVRLGTFAFPYFQLPSRRSKMIKRV
ncbi:MAG: glycosyltransferase family 2 protein [Bacteroidales bacterium]